jgi:hypothetical protein
MGTGAVGEEGGTEELCEMRHRRNMGPLRSLIMKAAKNSLWIEGPPDAALQKPSTITTA